MKQIRPYVDDRLESRCVFCGSAATTRDHVPPRVFLDEPYPENLAVVACCSDCNASTSIDEQYVACLSEVLVVGSVDFERLRRRRIRRALEKSKPLKLRLQHALQGYVDFELSPDDMFRVSRVIEKTGRALWSYETGEPTMDYQIRTHVNFLEVVNSSFWHDESEASQHVFPEVGSRMLFREFESENHSSPTPWIEVQQNRFSYAVRLRGDIGEVKMIINRLFAAKVELRASWERNVSTSLANFSNMF